MKLKNGKFLAFSKTGFRSYYLIAKRAIEYVKLDHFNAKIIIPQCPATI